MNDDISSGEKLLNDRKSFFGIFTYILLFILIGMTAVYYFLAIFPIDGVSMENTLHDKHYCLVQRRAFEVERGDIVTLNTANNGEENHIVVKRVVATSGDKLVFMISENRIYVDLYICKSDSNRFEIVDEPYIKERMRRNAQVYENVILLNYTPWLTEINVKDPSLYYELSRIEPTIITVPQNSIYFLGDNRNNSKDSRHYGTRTQDKITSKVLIEL